MIRNEDVCAEVQNGLPLYVGGDLEPAQANDIALHLEQCAHCNELARAAHEARELLVSALALSERRGPDLWPNVRAVLSENGSIHAQPQRDVASSSVSFAGTASSQSSSSRASSVGASNVASNVAKHGASTSASSKSRSGPRLLAYSAAAAAALIAGLWLGRTALHSPSGGSPAGGSPDAGSQVPNIVTVPPNEGPAVPLVPVTDTGGLRPLRRGEVPLSQSAHSYFDSPWVEGWTSYDPTQATTAGERHAPRSQ